MLPFSLWAAPRVFVKFMAVVVAFLRKVGVQIYPYLDNWLIRGQSKDLVEEHVKLTRSTFWNLVLLINEQKLTFAPTQRSL